VDVLENDSDTDQCHCFGLVSVVSAPIALIHCNHGKVNGRTVRAVENGRAIYDRSCLSDDLLILIVVQNLCYYH